MDTLCVVDLSFFLDWWVCHPRAFPTTFGPPYRPIARLKRPPFPDPSWYPVANMLANWSSSLQFSSTNEWKFHPKILETWLGCDTTPLQIGPTNWHCIMWLYAESIVDDIVVVPDSGLIFLRLFFAVSVYPDDDVFPFNILLSSVSVFSVTLATLATLHYQRANAPKFDGKKRKRSYTKWEQIEDLNPLHSPHSICCWAIFMFNATQFNHFS